MNVPISGPIMKIKAKELALKMGLQSFSVVQDGWKDLSRGIEYCFEDVIVNLFCIL